MNLWGRGRNTPSPRSWDFPKYPGDNRVNLHLNKQTSHTSYHIKALQSIKYEIHIPFLLNKISTYVTTSTDIQTVVSITRIKIIYKAPPWEGVLPLIAPLEGESGCLLEGALIRGSAYQIFLFVRRICR